MITWSYFLPRPNWNPPDPLLRLNTYQITRLTPIRGNVSLTVPQHLLRIESSRRLTAADPMPPLLFSGVTQHLQYTDAPQRRDLQTDAAKELPPSPQTITVIIPIRKSAAWWDLAQDERNAFFRKSAACEGHTSIGLKYAQRIFRRLYHCRYLESAPAFDFITYFEFPEELTDDFIHLVRMLRDVNQNPEWAYVDAEAEIWARKVE